MAVADRSTVIVEDLFGLRPIGEERCGASGGPKEPGSSVLGGNADVNFDFVDGSADCLRDLILFDGQNAWALAH